MPNMPWPPRANSCARCWWPSAARPPDGLNDSHLTVAVIIEMVHLATLVHDDIIDEADLRRGRPSLAANWGKEVSVLLGDCLFAHALKLAASFPTPEICRAVAAATNTVCAGEILQTRSRGDFEVAAQPLFQNAGHENGRAFCLVVPSGRAPQQGDGRRAGKPCANTAWPWARPTNCMMIAWMCSVRRPPQASRSAADLAKGKMTLPVLIVRDRATPEDQRRLRHWLANWDRAHLAGVVGLIEKYEAFAESPDGDPALFVRRAAGAGGAAGLGRAGQAGGLDAFFGGTNRRRWGLYIRTLQCDKPDVTRCNLLHYES